MTDAECCSGCGAIALIHPWVGVTRDVETGAMTAFPICEPCYLDPAHRERPLKMHFFPRGEAALAVSAAAANILVEPRS
jgi:hypothetical protein